MAQYFNLTLDTTAPTSGVITVLNYYKDNATPIVVSASGAAYMKCWIDQTATPTEVPATLTWIPYATSWTPNFSVEGTNYVHAVFMDAVGNINATIFSSAATIFDKTAPVVTEVSINNGADITAVTSVSVRVTANDPATGGSGVASTKFTGDIASGTTDTFTWSDTDRAAGYKDCTVELSGNAEGVTRSVKTLTAQCADRAGNNSETKSDSIVLYTGGVDPVIVLKNASDTAVLEEYTNASQFTLALQILVGESSLVHSYKVWGDFNEDGGATGTPEPTDYTTWPASQMRVALQRRWTSADGDKVVNAKVKVEEGGVEVEKTLTVATVKFDATAPTIVLSSAQSVISDKTGHDSTVLTAGITDTYNVTEYKIVAYATSAAATAGTSADPTNVDLYGTTPITPATHQWAPTLLENKLVLAVPGEGMKYLVCYAKDIAGNWGKSNTATVSVDLTAPVGSITVDQYYNVAKGFTASATDASAGMSKMKAWVDTNSATTEPPATATEYDYVATTPADTAKFDWTAITGQTPVPQGNCYVHILYTDAAGNSAVTHSNAFLFDSIAPTGCSISTVPLTNTQTITVNLNASDTGSGMGMMKVYGDLDGASSAASVPWEAYAATKSVTLTNGDGTKTIYALFKDNAGNEIAVAVSCTTVLDTGVSAATLALLNTSGQPIGTHTSVRAFKAKIGTNDDATDIVAFKIYGDVGEGSTPTAEGDAPWEEFVYETGTAYMITDEKFLTTGDALKTVTVKVKDAAGNVSSAASASVTYDTTAPVVTVSDTDYNVISKQHTARLDAAAQVIANAYNDQMTFKFTPDSVCKAYKVCVNVASQTAAGATAIPMDGGSINMSGTGSFPASTAITAKIMGLDYENAIKAAYPAKTEWDGVYEVIVYCQDLAGNWSAVHPL